MLQSATTKATTKKVTHVIGIKTVFINLRVKIMSMSMCTIIRHYAMFSLKKCLFTSNLCSNIIIAVWCDGDKVHEDRKVYACWTCSWFKYCTSCSHVLPADEKVTLHVFVNKSGSCSREQPDVCKSSFVVTVLVLIFLLCTYYKFT